MSASQALLSRMQLTLHATRRTPHVSLLGASDVCLFGRKPTCSVRPGIVGIPGSTVIRLRPCMIMSTPPPWAQFRLQFPPDQEGCTLRNDRFGKMPSRCFRRGVVRRLHYTLPVVEKFRWELRHKGACLSCVLVSRCEQRVA